jgi:hypothetical protein
MRLDVATRNARANTIETTWGTAIIIRLRTGATLPATEGAAATGDLLVEITAPSDWAAAASGGTKVLAGDWTDDASDDGVIGHYEVFSSDGTTRRACGSAGGPGSGAELIVNVVGGEVVNGQPVTIVAWTFTEGNAYP